VADGIVPDAITIVGAREGSILVRQLMANLRAYGYEGRINLVHPRRPVIEGVEAYADVEDVPGELGQVWPLIAGHRCVDFLRGLTRAPSSVIMHADGFAEVGRVDEQDALVAWSRERGVPLYGPQAVGFASFPDRYCGINLPLADMDIEAGGLAVLAQSGGLLLTIVEAAHERGIGLHTLASTGNEAMIGHAELGIGLLERDDVTALAVYAESIRSTERFVALARAAAERSKPLVFLLGGRGEVAEALARSHTGAAVTSRGLATAVAEQYGVLLVSDIDELVWTLETLHATGYRRIGATGAAGVVAQTGGVTVLIADAFADAGLRLAEPSPETVAAIAEQRTTTVYNPLDVGPSMERFEVYRDMVARIAADPAFDCVAEARGYRPLSEAAGPATRWLLEYQRIFLEAVREHGKLPVLLSTVPLKADERIDESAVEGVLTAYGSRESAVKLRVLATWAAAAALVGEPEPVEGPPVETPAVEGGVLTGPAVRSLLDELPIRWPEEAALGAADDVEAAVERVGLPLVAKAEVAGMAHRASAGAVLVGLDTSQAAAAGVAYLRSRFGGEVVVSEQVAHEDELFVGFERNPQGDAVVAFGPGGSRAGEDVGLRVLPATREHLRRLVAAHEDDPARAEALLALLVALQSFVLRAPGIRAIDMNPVVFDAQGALTALDVKVHVA
jgi:acyl-CoA synthetase (NDP forming)